MEVKDIIPNHFYRAKKPRRIIDGGYDDRRVLWISQSQDKVQYDSPTLDMGRHYPTIPMERFLKWVGREITREDYMLTDGKKNPSIGGN